MIASLEEKAKEFVNDMILQMNFPTDGHVIWSSAEMTGIDDVGVTFSVRSKSADPAILHFYAKCHFSPDGLCMVQIFGVKDGEGYVVIALFRDLPGGRQYETREPQGHTRYGFYPVGTLS